jgi:hypothetical protein
MPYFGLHVKHKLFQHLKYMCKLIEKELVFQARFLDVGER